MPTSPTRNMRLVSPGHPSRIGGTVVLAVAPAARAPPPPAAERRHVDVDEVAVLERPVAGDAVAHDVVDRCAAALGIAAIAERRGGRAAGAARGAAHADC